MHCGSASCSISNVRASHTRPQIPLVLFERLAAAGPYAQSLCPERPCAAELQNKKAAARNHDYTEKKYAPHVGRERVHLPCLLMRTAAARTQAPTPQPSRITALQKPARADGSASVSVGLSLLAKQPKLSSFLVSVTTRRLPPDGSEG